MTEHEHNLTAADIPARTYRQPSVDIRAEGSAGYLVLFRDPTGFPHELRRFPAGAEGSAQARAYRDGVADGLVRAPRVLAGLLGS